MNTTIKYLKNMGLLFLLILVFSFFINIFNYFNLLNQATYKTILILFVAVSVFVAAFMLGKSSKKNGYLEGLKFGIISTLSMFLISYLAFDSKISLSNLIYYLILIISSSVGAMFGINKKKEKTNV